MTSAYVACAPHVPLLLLQDRAHNPGLWRSYETRVAEFAAFDPELVVVFGGNHYQGIHLNLAPTFAVGHAAEAVDDCGGFAGRLDVPMSTSTALASALVDDGFDLAVSYAMTVDHGFSSVLGTFFGGDLGRRPVIPIHINSLTRPRPTLKRCRQLGEAVGRFAATLGMRVAFLGSGGLSHETESIFPQYDDAPTPEMRDYMVHGDRAGGITQRSFNDNMVGGMNELSNSLIDGSFVAPWINPDWDKAFLDAFAGGDLTRFDDWSDADIVAGGGHGGGGIRMWIAAAAAGQAAGAPQIGVDYYSDRDSVAVGSAIAHSLAA